MCKYSIYAISREQHFKSTHEIKMDDMSGPTWIWFIHPPQQWWAGSSGCLSGMNTQPCKLNSTVNVSYPLSCI